MNQCKKCKKKCHAFANHTSKNYAVRPVQFGISGFPMTVCDECIIGKTCFICTKKQDKIQKVPQYQYIGSQITFDEANNEKKACAFCGCQRKGVVMKFTTQKFLVCDSCCFWNQGEECITGIIFVDGTKFKK